MNAGREYARIPFPPRRWFALSGLILAAALCGTYAWAKWHELRDEPVRPFTEMKGEWIQATSTDGMDVYNGIFRRDLRLPGHVRNAWIAVASCDGFEVTVNGRAVGWQHMWRPTRPFQTSLSERGQWLSWPKVALSLNFAREYQWTDHKSYLLPVLIDLTPYLHIGANVIGVEIESRQAPAKVRFDGSITLWSGEVVSLASSTEWQAEVKAPYFQNIEWSKPDYRPLGWRQAAITDTPPGVPLRTFNPRVYSTEFQGRWIRHPQVGAQESVWFQFDWRLDKKPDEAWLRLATNRNFELFINGRRGFPAAPDDRGLETGEWIYGHERAGDEAAEPEQMYSSHVGQPFIARQFTGPSEEPLGVDRHRFKSMATPDPDQAKEHDRSWALETQRPLMMRHDRAIGAFVGYNLTGLLHAGTNTIAIRLNRPAASDPANWPNQIAVDGEVTFGDGTRQEMTSDSKWQARIAGDNAAEEALVNVRDAGATLQAGAPLTKLQYRGTPAPLNVWPTWAGMAATTSGGSVLAFSGLFFFGAWRRRRAGEVAVVAPPWTDTWTAILFDALLPFTIVLAAVILVQATFGERSEQLWFLLPSTWLWSIIAAASLGAIAVGVGLLRRSGATSFPAAASALSLWIRNLPNTRIWTFTLIWLCLLTVFLRAYGLDFQPLDYDENPSLQALLSVARSGIPSYVPEAVWYTRSPLYHYITGGVVWLFGENLWAMRMPSVVFSVATGLLLYFCGSRLLNRPWVGMAAFVLTLIHPQMFMTGHMIRFYQQQQFFSLLAAYWFCKGFVTEQSQRYRYLTVAAFLAATLSQEITAVMAVPLCAGYLFFAGRKTIGENIKLLIAGACAMTVIVIDYLIYETHTMTRLEGFSTTMQADIGPHLWDAYNLATVFLSYSRVHLILSCMLFLGLPAALRERNRTVLALHLFFFGNIIMLNVMVTQVSARYVYWLFPLFFLLALDNARAGLAWLDGAIKGRLAQPAQPSGSLAAEPNGHTPARRAQLPVWSRLVQGSGLSFTPLACMGVLFAATVVSWSPWRLPGTYNTKLLADSNGAFQYIRSQLRPGDRIIVTQPHAKGALLEIGRVDYELHIPMVYDFVLRENGRLVERGAGAGVISSLEQFHRLCTDNNRIWIAIDREKFPFRGERIHSGHTGAGLEMFLRNNTQLMHRTHLWNVYLWDANLGLYRSFRHTTP